MPVGKKLVVVASVVTIGAIAALFFRKDASQVSGWQEAPVESAFRERVERRVAADASWATTTLGMRQRSGDAAPAYRVRAAETAAISRQPLGDGQPTFQKSFNPVGALLEPVDSTTIDDPLEDVSDIGPLADDASSGDILHTIVDGDTLSKLAERYLGRGDRYLEIFERNRDLLTNADLLPIGVVLKIPRRQTVLPSDGTRGAASSPATSGPVSAAPASSARISTEPALDLVPVEKQRRNSSG